MPRLIITDKASAGLENCRLFLAENNPTALIKAADTIEHYLFLLENEPIIGRPLDDEPDLRELIIPFGDSGYIALYHFDLDKNNILILAFRHQKEVGYREIA